MAWTQADADSVQAAITELAIGKRVVTVSYAGPPARTLTYQMAELPQLRSLLSEINRSIGGGATYRLGATRTGLGGGSGPTGAGGMGGCW